MTELKMVSLEELRASAIAAEQEKRKNPIYAKVTDLIADHKVEGIRDVWVSPRKATIEILAEGDWKHTHARLDHLIGTLGYELRTETVNKYGNGHCDYSDWYESFHVYKRAK